MHLNTDASTFFIYMKKKIIIITACFVALAAISIVALSSLSSQADITADREMGKLGEMPISGNPLYATVAPGLKLKIDTGSDISTITDHDLRYLDSIGCRIDTTFYPSLGRNGRGDMVFETVRYKVSLPLYNYTVSKDSLGAIYYRPIAESINMLSNVDFIPSSSGISVIGIDFLQRFKVEYQYARGVIALYLDMPEGYEKCCDIQSPLSLIDFISLGNRYYMDLEVEHRPYRFFIDTGIQRAHIKLPMSERKITKHNLLEDTIVSLRGKFPALVDERAWLLMGDRERSVKAYYYDNDEEDFAINPLNVFKQDVLLDFSNKELLLRPYCAISHYERPENEASVLAEFDRSQSGL